MGFHPAIILQHLNTIDSIAKLFDIKNRIYVKMSAPNQGRQSPEPERQTGAQQQDTPSQGSGKIDESTAKNEGKDDQTSGLTSNPTHILHDHSEQTTSKK